MFSWTSSASLAKKTAAFNDEVLHRKRLAQVLRYIASMHQSPSSSDQPGMGHGFVRPLPTVANNDNDFACLPISIFFQKESHVDAESNDDRCSDVFFTTESFRQLLSIAVDDTPPFSFYAATKPQHSTTSSSSSIGKKRTLSGSLKEDVRDLNNPTCWFRITRLAAQTLTPPEASDPDVRLYLDNWLAQTPQASTISDLLTYPQLEQAPKVSPAMSALAAQEIKSFLRRYKKYLRKRMYQEQLEPIYNRLFEWVQNQENNSNELVWGMGHACQVLADERTLVNGPILEVLVEVELDTDGTILVRPREHSGVTLNRQVVTSIRSSNSAQNDPHVLQQLHRLVADLETYDLCPGEPSTYIPLLKRIAVQLSSGGAFQSSSVVFNPSTHSTKLTVTEAWCLYARPRPSSVWARDATAFADQLMKGIDQPCDFVIPSATLAFTGEPCSNSLGFGASHAHTNRAGGVVKWMQSQLLSKRHDNSETKPTFPLPSSDAQDRIAEFLLSRRLAAVVCEGPPGCGKTQAIANTICAYLCLGKRVLVTSKNASALSVLRNRLPEVVQELCVDLSLSESTGVRQLQVTVERLSNRLTSSNCEMNQQKCLYLQVSFVFGRSSDPLDD
jgi:hypothetical protein